MAWTAPRTWVASEVVTAAVMNQHVRDNFNALSDRVQEVRKSTDENRNNTTALANDAALLFTAVAGQAYKGDVFCIFNAASSTIDAKVGFSFPAGTMSFGAFAMDPAVASGTIGSGTWLAASSATSGTTALPVGVASADTGVWVPFTYLCTTGGAVNLMWAQNTLTASNMTLKAGSSLEAKRVAT
jgi:hypothetical protein